jgi:hypothetical protein
VDSDALKQLLALRAQVQDAVVPDCIDLEASLPERPCTATVAWLREHWQCTQPTVSRRLGRLWDAELIDYRSEGRGRYRIRRLGPPPG